MFVSTLNSSYLIKEHPSMSEASGLFHEIISNFSTFWFSNSSFLMATELDRSLRSQYLPFQIDSRFHQASKWTPLDRADNA